MKTIHSFMGMALCSFPVMAQQSPNFLIIQCDHLTQRVVGAYGADPSCTPPIDRIASQGVTFANAYVGCPLSQPSRAALWSGLMPHQTNVRSNSAEHINPPLPDSIPTLGSLFTANGYEAVHFGKTHDMGSLRGFRHKEPVAKPFTDPEFPVNNDSFLDVGTCEDAVAYLSNPPQEPFICIADFQNPHNICGYVGENKGEHIDSPISTPLPLLPETLKWKTGKTSVAHSVHLLQPPEDDASRPLERGQLPALRRRLPALHADSGQTDRECTGSPLLHSRRKNTIVIVLADHGDGMGSHRMVTKQVSFYEEMTNVPFIIAGPGIHPRQNRWKIY